VPDVFFIFTILMRSASVFFKALIVVVVMSLAAGLDRANAKETVPSGKPEESWARVPLPQELSLQDYIHRQTWAGDDHDPVLYDAGHPLIIAVSVRCLTLGDEARSLARQPRKPAFRDLPAYKDVFLRVHVDPSHSTVAEFTNRLNAQYDEIRDSYSNLIKSRKNLDQIDGIDLNRTVIQDLKFCEFMTFHALSDHRDAWMIAYSDPKAPVIMRTLFRTEAPLKSLARRTARDILDTGMSGAGSRAQDCQAKVMHSHQVTTWEMTECVIYTKLVYGEDQAWQDQYFGPNRNRDPDADGTVDALSTTRTNKFFSFVRKMYFSGSYYYFALFFDEKHLDAMKEESAFLTAHLASRKN